MTPDPNTSAKVSRHKWEVYVLQMGGVYTTSKQEGAILLQRYRDTNEMGAVSRYFSRISRSGDDVTLLKLVAMFWGAWSAVILYDRLETLGRQLIQTKVLDCFPPPVAAEPCRSLVGFRKQLHEGALKVCRRWLDQPCVDVIEVHSLHLHLPYVAMPCALALPMAHETNCFQQKHDLLTMQ